MPAVVLLTTDRRTPDPKPGPRVRPPRPEAWIGEAYVDAVRRAGGLPLLVPPGPADLDRLLAVADAVVLTGGHFDIHPSHYGRAIEGRIDRVEPARTDLELALARACLERGVPVLGVCGGMQALAVAGGGTLIQDLPKSPIDHEQPTDPATPSHPNDAEGALAAIVGPRLLVNSTHHQAVEDPGPLLRACGWAPDGAIEAIEGVGHPFALGVQWHPELLGDDRLYAALIAAGRGYSQQ
jgi:putative glutamine amidotransferase